MSNIQSYKSSVINSDIPTPAGWKLYKWKDLMTSYDQGLIRSNRELSNDGVLYFKMNNITNDGFCDYSKQEFAQVDENEYSQYVLNNGDFLINVRNSYELVGKTCVVSGLVKNAVYNHMLIKIEHVDQRLNYYINALFSKTYWKKYIEGCRKGTTTVIALYKDDLEQIVIPIPPEDTFERIVMFEKTIRDSIEKNNAICADLEAMAKLLYDYWFVQFDFPDENGKPYKSSSGKMVWNDDLKREIPEGWEAGTLGDVLEKYSDGIAPEQVGELPYTPMDILPMNKMSFSEIGSQDDANSSLIRYKKYSVLFGAMRPYFHRVCIAPFDGVTRTTVFTLREKSQGELGFAYETINQDYAVKYATDHHVGTQQPYAEWENNLDCCPIPIPPRELRLKYSRKIANYIDAVIEKNMENQQLASLRDFLLPMLMNGQVKVGGKDDLPPAEYPSDEIREYMVAAEPSKTYDKAGM